MSGHEHVDGVLADEMAADTGAPAPGRRSGRTIAVIGLVVVGLLGTLIALATGLPRPLQVGDLEGPSTSPGAGPLGDAVQPGRLAFTAVDGRPGGVYLAEPDGSNPVRIAGGGGSTFHAVQWSPGGRHLLYQESSGRSSTFHVADAVGRPVFSGEGCCATWSSDGSMVAALQFVAPLRDRIPGSAVLTIVGLDGLPVASITLESGRAGNLVQVFWFPNGRAVIVDDLYLDSGDGQGDTWAVPLDGGEPRLFPVKPLYGAPTFFSPDGRDVIGEAPEGLVVAAADGPGRRLLAPDPNGWYASAWSPDGARIALLFGRGSESPVLHVVDAASGEVSAPVPPGATGGLARIAYLQEWSPDGRILFSTPSALWAVRADGSDPRLLVEGAYTGGWQPSLQADG